MATPEEVEMARAEATAVANVECQSGARAAEPLAGRMVRGRMHRWPEPSSKVSPRPRRWLDTRVINRGPRFWTAVTIGLALGLGAVAYLAGPEFAFSLVYALPVAAAAWFAGFRWASGVAVVSCTVWLAVEIAQGVDTQLLVALFNGSRRVALFLATAYVLAALRARLEEEARSARTDFLTGLGNARSFHEDAAAEMARASRYGHPFTVVYADVDNFRSINDDLGHH